MFESDSRYYLLEQAVHKTRDGREITYKRRRILPQGETLLTYTDVRVGAGERLDSIVARTLGDPLQFWQLCDANNAMNPFDLVEETGRTLRVPLPLFQQS